MLYKKLSLFFATAFLFTIAFGQEKKGGLISGAVKDARTKLPLIEAVITLSSNAFEGQKFALTDSTGTYSVKNLPAGNYTIAFEMEGYEKSTRDSVTLTDGMSLAVSFDMTKEKKRTAQSQKRNKESGN
jgi:Ca-activated chloride channel family protein